MKIAAYFSHYPHKQAVTLPALHLVQDELRCVPLPAIKEIADILDLSPAELYDAMSFYGFFRGAAPDLGETLDVMNGTAGFAVWARGWGCRMNTWPPGASHNGTTIP